MGKKICWAIILLTIAVNVVMLQWTVMAFLGRENEYVAVYSGVSVVMVAIAYLTYRQWKKLEYK